jgi:hypothetical protein
LATCGVTAWFEHRPLSLSHGNRRAVTYTAPGIPLKVSTEPFTKLSSMDDLLTYAPLRFLESP